jgi:DNA ligase (NAD+)
MDAPAQKLSASLEGKTIVISGNFSISRDDMKALIVAHGGKNSGSISGKTAYLLAGEKPGPEKIKKAEALGVSIISENDFRGLIGEAKTEIKDDIEPSLF